MNEDNQTTKNSEELNNSNTSEIHSERITNTLGPTQKVAKKTFLSKAFLIKTFVTISVIAVASTTAIMFSPELRSKFLDIKDKFFQLFINDSPDVYEKEIIRQDNISNFFIYFKEEEAYYVDNNKISPIKLTENLNLKHDLSENFFNNPSDYAYSTQLNDKKDTIFYFDNMYNSQDNTIWRNYQCSLFCRNLSKPQNSSVEITSDISEYKINYDGSCVTYISYDRTQLSQYSKGTTTTIETLANATIEDFYVSSNSNNIIYLTSDGKLYSQINNQKNDIASDVRSIIYCNKTCESIYYKTSNDDLYNFTNDNYKKITANFYIPVMTYCNGHMYYAKSPKEYSINLEDKLYDDLDSNYPDKESLKNEALEELSSNPYPVENYTLCYYDGIKETVLAENFLDSPETFFPYAVSPSRPIIAFATHDFKNIGKINLSDFAQDIYKYRDSFCKDIRRTANSMFSIEDNITAFDITNDYIFEITSDNSAIYWKQVLDDDKFSLDYSLVSSKTVKSPICYDSNISDYSYYMSGDKNFLYTKKDGDKECLFLNKKPIHTAINFSHYSYNDKTDTAIFFAKETDELIRKLYAYKKNKKTLLCEDIIYQNSLFASNGNIYFIKKENDKNYGDLILYKNGKFKTIDTNVTAIKAKWNYLNKY